MRIEKKILPEYFELIKSGKKTYDFRLGDFEINEGDILVLKEWTSYQPSLCVAITHAARGATLLYDGTSQLIPTKPLPAQELKNPVGAGDMFSAELAISLYRGYHPVTAVKKAHATTGLILSTNPIV